METYTVKDERIVQNKQKIHIIYLDGEPKHFSGKIEIDGKEYKCYFVHEAPNAFTIHDDTTPLLGKTVIFKEK